MNLTSKLRSPSSPEFIVNLVELMEPAPFQELIMIFKRKMVIIRVVTQYDTSLKDGKISHGPSL